MRVEDRILLYRADPSQVGELTDKTVFINRVAKVVKGGRRFNFSALVVTGDGAGHIGYGTGKAAEVLEAIKKASESARRNLFKVKMRGSTIPHDVFGKSGATKVMLKPGKPGSGIIAGGAVRAIVELAGISDIKTKIIGSSTHINVVRATIDGLLRLKSPEFISKVRGFSLEEMGYAPY